MAVLVVVKVVVFDLIVVVSEVAAETGLRHSGLVSVAEEVAIAEAPRLL